MIEPAAFYAAANLKDNPFRPNAVGVDDPRVGIWVGYDKQRILLERLLDRVRADRVGLTSFILLYGHYGTGKSHALLYSRNWVRKTGSGVAYYLSTLKRDKGKLSFELSIKEDLIDRGILVADLKRYVKWLENRILEVKQQPGGDELDNDKAIEKLLKIPELVDFAKRMCHTDGVEERIATTFADYLGSDHEAMTIFSRMVNVFVAPVGPENKRFVNGVYLFIDELDDIGRQPAKEALQTNDMLRHLYDSCPHSFGLVIAATAELNTLQHLFIEYVLSRVTRKVEFEILDQDAAVKFVREVLEKNRAADDKARSGFFPYTDEAVAAVVSHLRQITPRDVVNTMQQLLEETRLADLDPAKAGPVSSEMLDKGNVTSFIFGD